NFGGDSAVLGRRLVLDNESHLVIGVLPPMSYSYPASFDLMSPLTVKPGSALMNRSSYWLQTLGKLKPGVSLARGEAEMAAMTHQLALRFPEARIENLPVT